jgi:hypothetical protein
MSYSQLSHTTPKARKAYNCIWCGEGIQCGEVHDKNVAVYDGDLQMGRYHLECYSAASEYFKDEEEFTPWSFKRGTKEGK